MEQLTAKEVMYKRLKLISPEVWSQYRVEQNKIELPKTLGHEQAKKEFNRQTGRTTAMLVKSIELALNGTNLVLFPMTPNFHELLAQKLGTMLKELNIPSPFKTGIFPDTGQDYWRLGLGKIAVERRDPSKKGEQLVKDYPPAEWDWMQDEI